jgi:uncharacterized protein
VKEPAVLDTTGLIVLERVGRLDLLPAVYEPAFVPPAVMLEFGNAPSWIILENLRDQALARALNLSLGLGEAEALALASERKVRLITDDLKARKAAKKLGVHVTGTIGTLLRAKTCGVLAAIKPVIIELEGAGFFLSDALKTEALRLAHE